MDEQESVSYSLSVLHSDQDEQHCIQTLDEDILAAWPSLRYRKSVSGKCMPKVKCVPRAKAPSHWLTARAKVAARVALQIAPSPAPKVVIAKHDVPQDEESEAVGDRMQREHQHGEGKKSAPLVDAMEIVRRKGWTRPCEDAVWRRVRHLQLRRITKNEAMAFLHDFPLRAHWSVRQLSMGVGAIARVAFLFASSAIHLHCARAILSLEKPVLLKDEDVQLFHFCFQFIAQIGELWSRKESAPNDGGAFPRTATSDGLCCSCAPFCRCDAVFNANTRDGDARRLLGELGVHGTSLSGTGDAAG
eukprot:GEMP01042933.1.p1 GENE.GEMP01042933.1~~GEMP01042933.1.p1  ORF type:complete len:303 (+),score=66.70 GEMP01042933.1:287-1195(+)